MQPSIFSFELWGWPSLKTPNCFFQLVGNQIQFSSQTIRGRVLAFTVTAEQWQALWETCEVLDIWDLPEICGIPPMLVHDAQKFELKIEWAGRVVRFSGLYDVAPDDFVKRIESLYVAIQALVPPDKLAEMLLCIDEEKKREDRLERELEAGRIAKHNEECTALWNRASRGQFECANCENRDFRLSESPGQRNLVVCNVCGWSYPGDDELIEAAKRHNKECAVLWKRASRGQLECSNCKNRDFRLSGFPGAGSLVICNACGRSYPRDDE